MRLRRPKSSTDAIYAHVCDFFKGHQVTRRRFTQGPINQRVPVFAVALVAPGPRLNLWSYVSLGCWEATHLYTGHGVEFVLAAETHSEAHLETLAMVAYYHAGPEGQRLDHGHTVPIGRPWVGDSRADHLLVSSPYPYGPELEICAWDTGHARLLWLVPITSDERDFKATHGLEALEQRLEEAGTHYWDAARPSVADRA